MGGIKPDKGYDAVAHISALDIASRMPYGHLQPHLLHLTTLDGILQIIIVALIKGGRDVN
jgi:hypothetical protein